MYCSSLETSSVLCLGFAIARGFRVVLRCAGSDSLVVFTITL